MAEEPLWRRQARWRAAAASVSKVDLALDASCPPGALDRVLPLRLMPQPERCEARLVGRVDGSAIEIVEYAWSARIDGVLHRVRFESLVVIADNPRVAGEVAIERDAPASWRGEDAPGPSWVGATDHRFGIAEFDRAYRVFGESEERVRAALPESVARHLSRVRFDGVLELRPGRLVLGLPRARLSPEGAKTALRHLRGVVRAYPTSQGGPYRSG